MRKKKATTIPPAKRPSGGAKLKAAGKHAVLLGLQPGVYAVIKHAAELEMRPVTQFIVSHCYHAAVERVSLDDPDYLSASPKGGAK